MNLYGRFFLFMLYTIFSKSNADPFQSTNTSFRVWPHDIDVNMHLTAARYFAFGDFGRLGWLFHNFPLVKLYTSGFKAVLNAQEITYIREFKPFSKVDIVVELKCWDQKYGYFEQCYYHKGKLFAVAHSRMAMLHKGKVVSFTEAFKYFGVNAESKAETLAITDWKQTLNAKKQHFAGR